MAPKAAVPAPESARKRLTFKAAQTKRFRADIHKKQAANKALKHVAFSRGKAYAQDYRRKESRLVTVRRRAKTQGHYYVEEKPKLAIVMRIRGVAKVPPKARKVLQLLRLRQIFNAVFVKFNKPMENMLRLVEPYIAYGYPSLKTVRGMVYKRGHLKMQRQRVKIRSNEQVQRKFKQPDVVCVEDIVNQIYTVGKNFRTVANGLWPFKLAPPKGGMRKKRRHFIEGGDYGNRETLINRMLHRMV